MHIVSFWPAEEAGPTLGHFDIEVFDGLRICGLRLILNEQGQYRTIPPKMGTRRSITFIPDVATKITGAAVDRHKELQLNGRP